MLLVPKVVFAENALLRSATGVIYSFTSTNFCRLGSVCRETKAVGEGAAKVVEVAEMAANKAVVEAKCRVVALG
jgi:hypothetical protein